MSNNTERTSEKKCICITIDSTSYIIKFSFVILLLINNSFECYAADISTSVKTGDIIVNGDNKANIVGVAIDNSARKNLKNKSYEKIIISEDGSEPTIAYEVEDNILFIPSKNTHLPTSPVVPHGGSATGTDPDISERSSRRDIERGRSPASSTNISNQLYDEQGYPLTFTPTERRVYAAHVAFQNKKKELISVWLEGQDSTASFTSVLSGENAYYVLQQSGNALGLIFELIHVDQAIQYVVWRVLETSQGKLIFELAEHAAMEARNFGEAHPHLKALFGLFLLTIEVSGIRALSRHIYKAGLEGSAVRQTIANSGIRFVVDKTGSGINILKNAVAVKFYLNPKLANKKIQFDKKNGALSLPNAFDQHAPSFVRRFQAIKQLTKIDCGPTCAKMVLEDHGIIVSRSKVASLQGVVLSEWKSLTRVLNVLDTNYTWRATKLNVALQTKSISKPFIAILKRPNKNIHHAVVIEALHKKWIVLSDPANGKRWLVAPERIKKMWDGAAIVSVPKGISKKFADLVDRNTEILFGRRFDNVNDILKPNGELIGVARRKNSPSTRTISQDQFQLIKELFLSLKVKEKSVQSYDGTMYSLPSGGHFGIRVSKKYGETIDVKASRFDETIKLHYK